MENYIKHLAIQLQDIQEPEEGDKFLEEYFLVNQKSDYRETLNDPDYFNELIVEVNNIYNFNKLSVCHDSEMKLVLNKLISSICMIKDHDKKKLTIPLIIYLDANNILYNFLIKKGFFDNLINCVTGSVENFRFKINKGSLANNHWESESYIQYEDGVKNLNISDIYQFIEAYERSGRVFENSAISLFSLLLCTFDFNKLCNVLDEKKDTITLIFLISNLSIMNKLLLAKQSKNVLLKLEVLKQVLYCSHNRISCSILYENEHVIIERILLDISKDGELWEQFLKFYMPFPSRSPLLFKSLGSTLDKLGDSQLDLFLKSININWNIDDDTSAAINACFFNIKNDDFQKEMFIKILNLWELNLVNFQESMHGLKLSNVINICITTIREFTKKEDIESKVNFILGNISEIDNHWFDSELAQNNYLYKQLTFLFLYGFVHFNLNDLESSIRNVLNSPRTLLLLKREYSDSKTTLQCFEEYIFND